ncbi:MAG: hypothetical protein ACTSO7_01815 [Candidatus Heimdallarchaeota archaeon]
MARQGLGNEKEAELIRAAIVSLNTTKTAIQDHILERTAVVPEDTIKMLMMEFGLSEEFAKTIFVLEFEYNIDKKLSADYFHHEMKRLKKVSFELPDIYSFRVRFSAEEGFWLKYLSAEYPRILFHKLSKLTSLDRSLFGDLEGDKEDAALYILERNFICNELIKPQLQFWVQEHHYSNYYDGAKNFLSAMQQKSQEKGELLVSEMKNRFLGNLKAVKAILKLLPKKGYIENALKEFDNLEKAINDFEKDPTSLTLRLAAEIILENRLVMEYSSMDLMDLVERNPRAKAKMQEPRSSVMAFSSKSDQIIKDKISMTMPKLVGLTTSQIKPLIRELIQESFNDAIVKRREKPVNFAKNFLERIMIEIDINPPRVVKLLKKFDQDLMFRMSAAGKKEYSYLTVDEKIARILEEYVLEVVLNREEYYEEVQKELLKQQLSRPKILEKPKAGEEDQKKPEHRGELIRTIDEKGLFYMIRDAYLKELFEQSDEVLAAGKVLKKMSIDLGLLMTDSEATSLITQALAAKDLTIDKSSKEEIDAGVCKVVFKQIKEQRNY